MRVLAAGVGVLGRELIDVLFQKSLKVSALGVRDREFEGIRDKLVKTFCADVTKPGTLKGICKDIDMVISTIGITRMKGNLTHQAVDYQGNLNLLREAEDFGVKKFVFISPAGVDQGHTYVPLFKAKHLFEQELKKGKINWLIFRSGGFYRDLAEMARSARKGSMFVLGNGSARFTPIDVRELAEIMVDDSLKLDNRIIEVGGPQDLSWKEICHHCFAALETKPKVASLPIWMCRFIVWGLKPFSLRYFSLGRLIIFSSVKDLPTPKRGKVRFPDYLKTAFLPLKTE